MHRFLWIFLLLVVFSVEAKLPEIVPQDVTFKAKELMRAHASHKKLTPILAQRLLLNYLEIVDPNKTYFIESDISLWVEPSDVLLNQLIENYYKHNFTLFFNIQDTLVKAIKRRRQLEKQIDYAHLPNNVQSKELKNLTWVKNEEELLERLKWIRALQLEATNKLSDEVKEKAMQRIAKLQAKFEEEALDATPKDREKLILSNILKATASSLDTHTVYFTPGEASQFMVDVQHRLFGIGAQLRDDVNGLTVIKIVEGSPAAEGKELKEKDRIIAVNGEPIVGLYISDAVELIRGEENTPVVLTIIRESVNPEGIKKEEKLDIKILRGEVIVKEARLKSSYEPFGNGVIGHLKLYSFYEDRENSSAEDLKIEIEKLKKEHHLLGLVLDLRYNSGGLLTQAVDVTGLFITQGIVVSIKDETGQIQHLRALDEEVTWDGPLIILVSRMSASASEIVAQTLQDYGRAILVGDDHTFGKGSYQTFTLTTDGYEQANPEGEYKVTRGRYYTVSGKTPQLVGVLSDVVVPGVFCESEVGERFAKYPLENDQISSNFIDDLSDVPPKKHEKIRKHYGSDLQPRLDLYHSCLDQIQSNSEQRIQASLNYQNFLKELKKKEDMDSDHVEKFGQNDLQLEETYDIMKDLIVILQEKNGNGHMDGNGL
ncbi:MAG: S41 family peptidase [Chlamydiales bacterium]